MCALIRYKGLHWEIKMYRGGVRERRQTHVLWVETLSDNYSSLLVWLQYLLEQAILEADIVVLLQTIHPKIYVHINGVLIKLNTIVYNFPIIAKKKIKRHYKISTYLIIHILSHLNCLVTVSLNIRTIFFGKIVTMLGYIFEKIAQL